MYLSNILTALRYNRLLNVYLNIYKRFSQFTMIPKLAYADNPELCQHLRNVKGDVVECGVWRGGMIAGIPGYWATPVPTTCLTVLKVCPL
jgi:hypothetical protein